MNGFREQVSTLLKMVLEASKYNPLIGPYTGLPSTSPPTPYLHQMEVLSRLFLRRPVRVLLADEVGLGKTVTALLLIRYLKGMEGLERILILVPRILVNQWVSELLRMGFKYHEIRLIERETIDRLLADSFPPGVYLASMDLVKLDRYFPHVERVRWDLIVVDEAHRLGMHTDRFETIGKRLIESDPRRHVLLLTATPHRGDPNDYLARLKLLDPQLNEERRLDSRPFYILTHYSLVFRRTKDEINKVYEETQVFPPARFMAYVVTISEEEKEFSERLLNFLRTKIREYAELEGKEAKAMGLLTAVIFKRASSSPRAALLTLQRMLEKRAFIENLEGISDRLADAIFGTDYYEYEEEVDPDEVINDFVWKSSGLLTDRDRMEIQYLLNLARRISQEGDSKLKALGALLKYYMEETDSKVIVFTEYRDTLDYIYNWLIRWMPSWRDRIVRMTADESRSRKKFQEVKRKFERSEGVRILLATDVASEGLNLQVANVLINYEIPWSIIKVEQRLGRVWRLGQRREVEAITMFTSSKVDRDALDIVYKKLLNIRRATGHVKALMGEEVYVANPSEWGSFPEVTIKEGKKGRPKKFTEYASIKAELLEGREGLRRLVESILRAKEQLEREIREKNLYPKPRTRKEVEKALSKVGFMNQKEIYRSAGALLKAIGGLFDLEVNEGEDGVLRVRSLTSASPPYTIKDYRSLFDYLEGLVKTFSGNEKLVRLLTDCRCGRTSIYMVSVTNKENLNLPLYKELIGYDFDNGRVLRGRDLYYLLAEAIDGALGSPTEMQILDIDMTSRMRAKVRIMAAVRDSAHYILWPLENYLKETIKRNFRNTNTSWLRYNSLKIDISGPLIEIIPVERSPSPSVELVGDLEELGIDLVKKYEESHGRRIVKDVRLDPSAHYDLKSIDERTGEMRIIEVKGHMGNVIYGELTEAEWELARREGDRYWLYIVYNLEKREEGGAVIACFRNPLKTMNVMEVEKRTKRYILRPKGEPTEVGKVG